MDKKIEKVIFKAKYISISKKHISINIKEPTDKQIADIVKLQGWEIHGGLLLLVENDRDIQIFEYIIETPNLISIRFHSTNKNLTFFMISGNLIIELQYLKVIIRGENK